MNSKFKLIILYLFFITFVVVGISFSRFSTTVTNSGAESTLPPDIEFSVWMIDYASEPISLENMKPGESREIEIWVKNWKQVGEEWMVSGYNQAVNLELETTANLPLIFTLEEYGGDERHLSSYGKTLYKSENITFIENNAMTKEFILTVTWPENLNDDKYKDEIDYLVLSLKAVQAQ